MKVTDTQLDNFITLYQEEYKEVLERPEALKQLRKLVNLVALFVLPPNIYSKIAFIDDEGYNKYAVQKENFKDKD